MSQQNWGSAPPVYGRQTSGSPVNQPRIQPTQGFTQPMAGYGGFGGGVPHYGPAPHIPAPAAQRSPLRFVLLAMIGLVILALAALAVTSLTANTPNSQYQNDDYTVPPPDNSPPPLPLPEDYRQADDWINNSTFYAQVTPAPVRCASQPINVTTATDEQLKAHFEGLMECLVRVWQPPVTNAGFQIVRPTVTVYGQELTTKCGKSGINAFYCGADQQVYYSNQLPEAFSSEISQNKWTADLVMAHEFGHALQGRTGVLVAAHALGQKSGDKDTNLAYTRRLETQADCFSGMFIRSVSTSLGVQDADTKGILAIYQAIGDDTLSGDPGILGNHGLARSRRYWGNVGLVSSSVGNCNTFKAASKLVR